MFTGWLLLISALCIVVDLSSAQRNLTKAVRDDIRQHQSTVNDIISLVMDGEFKHKAYEKLAYLTDTFSHRLSGSDTLEQAIDYVMEEMRKEGFDKVEGEEVMVPSWRRGEESGKLLTPVERDIVVLGLGQSVGTQAYPEGKLTAQVILVNTFDELDALKSEVEGKIVVFNPEWKGYFDTVKYRSAAGKASEYKAVAALVRSMTGFSLYTPHTGVQSYGDADPIPTACITVEDADLIQRLYRSGKNITMQLFMDDENLPERKSRNIVAEITGSEFPDEIILFGGHIDSWDVGAGVMDDGGGVAVSWQVLSVIKKLGLRPKRTLRCVLWTAEEFGLIGAYEYHRRHKGEKDNMVLMMESDYGVFSPRGILVNVSGLAQAYLEEIMDLQAASGTTRVATKGATYPDLSMWDPDLPLGTLDVNNERYFWWHHTKADTLTIIDPDDLDMGTIIWAGCFYVVANINDRLPRTGDYPFSSNMAASVTFNPLIVIFLYVCIVVIGPHN